MSERSGWQLASGSMAEANERYIMAAFGNAWAQALVQLAAPEEGDRVLDVACGTGPVARYAAPLVGPTGRVIGLDLNAGMLATLTGAITEMISGVFFYLYNKTIQEFNRFHAQLAWTQDVTISLLADISSTDPTQRNQCRADLAKQLLTRATHSPPNVDQQMPNAPLPPTALMRSS